jgi:hypothetical protein
MLCFDERPLCARSGHSMTVHSANLKKTSRSLTINQCSGGSFLRGQYRQLLPDRRSTPTLDGYYVGKRVSFSDKPGPSR